MVYIVVLLLIIVKQKEIDWKSISVAPETKDELLDLCRKNETYDDFVKRLLVLRKRHLDEFEKIILEQK